MKIFIGLREISGYYNHLKRGFDALGVESVFVNLGGQRFDFEKSTNPPWISKLNSVSQKMSSYFMKNIFMRMLWLGVLQNIISFFLFFWAIVKFDTFIFVSNSTFFFYLDLPILKLFRKKIIYVFHGSDSRPVYLGGKAKKMFDKKKIRLIIFLAKIQRIIISIIDRYADAVVNLPPQAYFHKRPCVSFLALGFPSEFNDVPFSPKKTLEHKAVRILHAPSSPEVKGTLVFRKIIQELKDKGHAIDYREITNITNSEVLKEIEQCDFVLDELYSDMPVTALGVEAAYFSKATVIGGYYADFIRRDLPKKYIFPSLFCRPEKMKESIEKLIVDKKLRDEIGHRAHEFVVSEWGRKNVAKKYLRVIAGDIPADWMFSPYKTEYISGVGVSEENIKKMVKAVVDVGGIKALGLTDKPVLEKSFKRFIE